MKTEQEYTSITPVINKIWTTRLGNITITYDEAKSILDELMNCRHNEAISRECLDEIICRVFHMISGYIYDKKQKL